MGGKSSKSSAAESKSSPTSSSKSVTDRDRAVLQLKLQRDKLSAQQRRLGQECELQLREARASVAAQNKSRALYHMRRRKALLAQAERVEAHLSNIETLVLQVEWSALEADVFGAIRVGGEALAELNRHLSVQDAEAIVDAAAEQIAVVKDVSELLAQALSSDDEAAAAAELDALEAEQLQQQLLPAVPTTALPAAAAVGTSSGDVAEKGEEGHAEAIRDGDADGSIKKKRVAAC